MGKRANGEGTISKRKNSAGKVVSYRAAIVVDDPRTGQQVRHFRSFKTQQDARTWLDEIKHQKRDGAVVLCDKTLGVFLDEWLAHVSSRLAPRTVLCYRGVIDRQLKPDLGKKALNDLRPLDLDRLYKKLLERQLSARSVQLVHVTLHAALNQAVKWQLTSRNIADAASPPKVKHTKKIVLTVDQARNFLVYCQDHRLFALFFLALATGMRRGELLGLQWHNVDFERALILVRDNLIEMPNGTILSTPKTDASIRDITVARDCLDVLRTHRDRQHHECTARGSGLEHQFVFTSRAGTTMTPSALNKTYKSLLLKAGAPAIRFHDLRHTSASLLILKGISSKVVADRLGHTSASFTEDTYVHLFETQRRAATLSLAEIFATEEGDPRQT